MGRKNHKLAANEKQKFMYTVCVCVSVSHTHTHTHIRTYPYISVHIYTIPKLKPFSKYFVLFLNHYATGDRFFCVKAKELFLLKLEKCICHLTHLNVPMWSTEMPINETLPGKKFFFIQYLIYVFSLGFAIESHLTQLQINENPRQCCEYK